MPGRAWLLLAVGLAAGALLTWVQPPAVQAALEWQPDRAWEQPWRAFTAALLHWSPQHLIANLAGCAVVGLLGVTARLGRREALAWLLAWPLTQLGLLWEPQLTRFGGLSGVLHAGVAVAAVALLRAPRAHGRTRAIGLLIAIGLAVKVAGEQPLADPPLRHWEGWSISIAPLAHLTGVVSGTLTAVIGMVGAAWWARRHGTAAATEQTKARPIQ
ncbi:rhomboid family GlyGly-CTERM serine protease [Roseateles sp. YR242]|uniref:rhombosortase n=1 Tax=Roseateles sp. YR242 TaxID=1855305 RepID=UPI0008AB4EC6|nr:rhombosortase [Roseateles sp. YR242]SEL78662.1 rhomboid family GlyGly-CTERM serine protease [Roseateles sp. YR242]